MEYKKVHSLTGAVSLDETISLSNQNNFDKKMDNAFCPSAPTTWPNPPDEFNPDFYETIKKIFNESMMREIENVLGDIKKCSPEGLEHRGHVIALVLLCAVDSISSYAYSGYRYKKFIEIHFPKDYKPYASEIFKLYRHNLVHSWNLFEASMSPGKESIKKVNGTIRFGLLNFYDAIKFGLNNFLAKLEKDVDLQKVTLKRYKKLKLTAK